MLPVHCHRRIHVATQADLTTARGALADLTATLGGDEETVGRIRLVVSELATNLIRHAGDGVLLLRGLHAIGLPGGGESPPDGRPAGFECLSLDKGPGIADIGGALADRNAQEPVPGGSLGYGLGAVRRLADRFDIHSVSGIGTAVLAQVYPRRGHTPRPPPGPFAWGAAMVPMAGCDACGDGWTVRPDGLVLVVDGLGHGEAASVAARRAEAIFAASPSDAPQDILLALHEALRGTRGAVGCVLKLNRNEVEFSCIGNITATVLSRAGATSLGGRWGVIGYNAVPPPPIRAPWGPGDQIVLHSDGCSHLADLVAARHLRHVDPALAAGVLLRDGICRVDDQTVLVLTNRADG